MKIVWCKSRLTKERHGLPQHIIHRKTVFLCLVCTVLPSLISVNTTGIAVVSLFLKKNILGQKYNLLSRKNLPWILLNLIKPCQLLQNPTESYVRRKQRRIQLQSGRMWEDGLFVVHLGESFVCLTMWRYNIIILLLVYWFTYCSILWHILLLTCTSNCNEWYTVLRSIDKAWEELISNDPSTCSFS